MSAPHATSPQSLANFVWRIADQLRGVYKPNQYGMVVLPLTILRRMEQQMAPHRQDMRELAKTAPSAILPTLVEQKTGLLFFNTSPWDLRTILEDPDSAAQNLLACVAGFSSNVADLFQHYEFEKTVDKLADHGRLILVLQQFAAMDLGPAALSNADMGTMFEDLIRRFAAASNETAGEYFTPRDAVALIVDLLLAERTESLEGHAIRHAYEAFRPVWIQDGGTVTLAA
ncbi:type I restriction-modification system subunit M N-terminal domain-containing protein [Micrococcus luteus]|nr:type I restriction-modification system subunit M N-terminal domain-containing protein [Micrococcus luteus]